MGSRRRENVLLTLLLIMVVGTSTIFAQLFILTAGATRSQLVSLFGPTAGAMVAAVAGIIAIEWQESRRERTSKRIVTDLLSEAQSHWKAYAEWIDRGAPAEARSKIMNQIEAFVGATRAATSVARHLQTSTPGMARVVLALEHEASNLANAEAATTSPYRDIDDNTCKEALGKTVTAIFILQSFLRGESAHD